MPQAPRSTEEIITLSLCALSMMGLALFAVVRFMKGDLIIALIDLVGLITTSIVFIWVYRERSISRAGPLLSILALTGTVAIIAAGGPDNRYLLYPTVIIAFFLATPGIALPLSCIAVLITGIVMLPELPVFQFGQFLLSISGCILFAYIFATERNSQRDTLLLLSTVDGLTGAGNRRAFDQKLEETVRVQLRSPAATTMMLIDLDNFKKVNDTEGHSRGDEVLKLVADTLGKRLRAGDNLFRYGGDEFVVLAEADINAARKLAEELRQLVETAQDEKSLHVTLSIGLAVHLSGESANNWLNRADNALFEAKDAGRNQVVADQQTAPLDPVMAST